ncbi:MAG: PH domain-containing protein [Planctomycetota bacterium]
MSNEPDPNHSESPPKDQFSSAAKEKIDAARSVPPERSLWKGGYSPKAMYGSWVISALATIGLIVAGVFFATEESAGDNAGTVWMVIGTIIVVWWIVVIGTYLYRRVGMHYELTTQRFIHQAGILMRTTDRIEVIDIDDVSYTQGIIQRMLGVGKIRITGSDRTHPELVLYGIDKVPEIASLIDDVRREERRRRSLHIESI